ncbi:phosphatase PAP2 family protein [Candidatus Gracilibacteria bacterium]|nr:phosphatase PAP2 family protein [Candidatus Gracilibacteria bacterium]
MLNSLLFGVYFPLLIFVELAIAVWQNGGSLSWDISILLAIHQIAQTRLDSFAAMLTELGTSWGVVPVTAIIALILLLLRQWLQSLYLLTTVLGGYAISVTVKTLLHRARPSLWELSYPLPSDYAFPSGHAMSSMTLVVALIVLSWGSRWSASISIFGTIFAVAIGWTRMYLGVHFPSDVLGGWMLAIAWGIGVSLLLGMNFSQKNLDTTNKIGTKQFALILSGYCQRAIIQP